jgi:hypothetical protein
MKRKEFLAKQYSDKRPELMRNAAFVAYLEGYNKAKEESAKAAHESSWRSLSLKIAELGEEEV